MNMFCNFLLLRDLFSFLCFLFAAAKQVTVSSSTEVSTVLGYVVRVYLLGYGLG